MPIRSNSWAILVLLPLLLMLVLMLLLLLLLLLLLFWLLILPASRFVLITKCVTLSTTRVLGVFRVDVRWG